MRAEAVLLDLSGVLYVEDEPIDGATEAVRALQRSPLEVALLTNTTVRSRRQILDKLERLGIEARPEQLVTPTVLAREHCVAAGHQRIVLYAASELAADLEPLDVAAAPAGDAPEPGVADAVVLGDLGERFTWRLLSEIHRHLDAGAELVALHRNRVWQTSQGPALDLGPFVAALEYATDTEATVVGKPAPRFFELALARLDVEPSAAVMVGDDVESDVGGAQRAGLRGILVRTGKWREGAAERAGVEPTATVDSIADVPGLLGVDRG